MYQVTPDSLDEANTLKQFENDEHFDFWSDIRFLSLPVDIMVSPLGQNNFETVLKSTNIDYSISIDNVEA